MLNSSESSAVTAAERTSAAVSQPGNNHPLVTTSRALTELMRHGGLYSLLDRPIMMARLTAMAAKYPEVMGTHTTVASFVASAGAMTESFFQHLVQKPYMIYSNLMSHIAFPHEGTTYTPANQDVVSPELPAAITFIGQFIDHDLTMNALELFTSQTGDVQNTASPLIDLDSVYGPRTLLDTATTQATATTKYENDLYEDDGKTLRLKKLPASGGKSYYDLMRDDTGAASISDKRNDENQMVLQVHLLLMRVHNKLVEQFPEMSLQQVRREVILNWQSVLAHDYLPSVLEPSTLAFLLEQIKEKEFGLFFYKPLYDLHSKKYVTCMPHEFAIAFRFGHSQLKAQYSFRAGPDAYPLFNNQLVPTASGATADLRGSQMLPEEHVIDWDFFAGPFHGNRIDGKVTSAVFDLPESAIPDDIKFIGNLVQRNLIRSRELGLCSGEDLANAYGIPVLAPIEIEPDVTKQALFQQDGGDFRTPLWYYILREAQSAGTPTTSKLGLLGSRLIGEVILGAIHWGDFSVIKETAEGTWKSKVLEKLNGSSGTAVKFLDLAHYAGVQPG